MVKILNNNILSRLSQILTTIQKYDYIYISIGSKPNKSVVPFTPHDKMSNAYEQMFPVFLQRDDTQILIIAIDQFNKNNLTHVSNHIDNITTDNIDFYILNTLCGKDFLIQFMQLFLEKLKAIDFSSNSLMICNYVRFMNTPNNIEFESEKMIPDVIQSSLNRTQIYDSCFYQWFGYRYYFYNYVYNYKNLQNSGQKALNGINYTEVLLEKLSKHSYTPVVVQNEDALFILKNIYNICDVNHVNEYILCNLYEEFKLYNSILYIH
jgi:hypothetical protein